VSSVISRSRRSWRLLTSSNGRTSRANEGDPANGLLLCRNHHQAFERDLFTLSDEYAIVPRPDLTFESQWLRSTITDRAGDELEFPNDPPSSEYLGQYNERFSWIGDE
jgi:predicted restriction endonuclease